MIALMITILVIGIAVDAVFAAVDRGSGPPWRRDALIRQLRPCVGRG